MINYVFTLPWFFVRPIRTGIRGEGFPPPEK